MRISSFTGFIPGFRLLRLDNGPVLIGIAVAAAVIEAAFLFSLFLPATPTATSTAAADTAAASPMRVISAASRGVVGGAAPTAEVPCRDQTWPFIDRKCLTQAAEKRPSHGARSIDLNAPADEVGAIQLAGAPAPRDTFAARFWPVAISAAPVAPSTDGLASKVKETVPPQETRSVRVLRPVVPVREARRPAGETRTAVREVRSDIVRSPDGRQWKRTTYTAPLASGGTKTFQVTRPLQQHHASWGVFGRGF